MKTLAIVISALISLGGYTQSNKDCALQNIGGRWATPLPHSTDSIIVLQKIEGHVDTRSSTEHFFNINSDSVFAIHQRVWRCGNDPALRMPYPLGYWKKEAGCSFSYRGSTTTGVPILYTVSEATENTLTLRRIR